MLHFLIVSSALVMSIVNVDADCKSFVSGAVVYPLDFCVSYAASGVSASYKYVCDGSTVSLNSYSGKKCSSSAVGSSSVGTSTTCSGGKCEVADIKTYVSSTCATSDEYTEMALVTGECISYSTSISYKYSCTGGNVTLWSYYDSNNCTGSNTSSDYYYDGQCGSSYYYQVTCNAEYSSSSSSTITISFVGMIISVIALLF